MMDAKEQAPSADPSPLPSRLNLPCSCLVEFYREELLRHHQCLELQREYYSEGAIAQAEEGVRRLMQQIEALCLRENACELIAQVLRKLDVVTRLSAWTDPELLH